jgi:hypothetical protein
MFASIINRYPQKYPNPDNGKNGIDFHGQEVFRAYKFNNAYVIQKWSDKISQSQTA